MMNTPQDDKSPIISIREFLERILEERDRLYNIRFEESKIAVNAALIAQKDAVTSAFAASEKAIIKAEEAQKDYNIRSNEFRGQLDDQAKTLMPRPETTALFRAVDEKLLVMQNNYDSRLESLRASFEKSTENLSKEIGSLRESRSESAGHSSGGKDLWGYFVAIAAIVLSIIFHFVK